MINISVMANSERNENQISMSGLKTCEQNTKKVAYSIAPLHNFQCIIYPRSMFTTSTKPVML